MTAGSQMARKGQTIIGSHMIDAVTEVLLNSEVAATRAKSDG